MSSPFLQECKGAIPFLILYLQYAKANSSEDIESLTCRFCANDLLETQEHLEICDGTMFERRGLGVSEGMGRRMTQKTAIVTSITEVHLPGNGSPTTLGVYK